MPSFTNLIQKLRPFILWAAITAINTVIYRLAKHFWLENIDTQEKDTKQKQEINKLKEQDGKQQQEINKLKEQDGKQKQEIKSLKEQDGKQQQEINRLQEQDTKQQQEIKDLKEKIAKSNKGTQKKSDSSKKINNGSRIPENLEGINSFYRTQIEKLPNMGITTMRKMVSLGFDLLKEFQKSHYSLDSADKLIEEISYEEIFTEDKELLKIINEEDYLTTFRTLYQNQDPNITREFEGNEPQSFSEQLSFYISEKTGKAIQIPASLMKLIPLGFMSNYVKRFMIKSATLLIPSLSNKSNEYKEALKKIGQSQKTTTIPSSKHRLAVSAIMWALEYLSSQEKNKPYKQRAATTLFNISSATRYVLTKRSYSRGAVTSHLNNRDDVYMGGLDDLLLPCGQQHLHTGMFDSKSKEISLQRFYYKIEGNGFPIVKALEEPGVSEKDVESISQHCAEFIHSKGTKATPENSYREKDIPTSIRRDIKNIREKLSILEKPSISREDALDTYTKLSETYKELYTSVPKFQLGNEKLVDLNKVYAYLKERKEEDTLKDGLFSFKPVQDGSDTQLAEKCLCSFSEDIKNIKNILEDTSLKNSLGERIHEGMKHIHSLKTNIEKKWPQFTTQKIDNGFVEVHLTRSLSFSKGRYKTPKQISRTLSTPVVDKKNKRT